MIKQFLKREDTFENFQIYFQNKLTRLSELYSFYDIDEYTKNEFLSILFKFLK